MVLDSLGRYDWLDGMIKKGRFLCPSVGDMLSMLLSGPMFIHRTYIFFIFLCMASSDAMEKDFSPRKRLKYSRAPSMSVGEKKYFGDVKDNPLTIDRIQKYIDDGGSIDDYIDDSVIGVKLMHAAAVAGKIDVMAWLRERGMSCMVLTRYHQLLAIHYAAQHGQLEVLQWLHKNGADINVRSGSNEMKPIHYAAQAGFVNVLQWLYDKGVSVEEPTRVGFRAVHLAAKAGKLDALRWLFEHGAAMNEQPHLGGCRPIHLAARGGHIHILQWFYETMIVNPSDEKWQEIFRSAISADQIGVLEWLHERGLGMHYGAHGGLRSSSYAIRGKESNVVEWLIDHGMVINGCDTEGRGTVALVYEYAKFAKLILLIAHGTDLSSKLPEPLLKLLTKERSDCRPLPKIILTKKRILGSIKEAILTISDIFKMAAGQGKKELLQCVVIEHGAELKLKDYTDALVGAATAGHIYIVDLLKELMDRDNTSDAFIREALSRSLVRATAQRREDVVMYLVATYGDLLDEDSVTEAFVRATDSDSIEIVGILRDNLISTNKYELLGKGLSRALARAAIQGNEEFIEYLLTHGADWTEAEEALKELLLPFTKNQIVEDSLLQRHFRIFTLLNHQRIAYVVGQLSCAGAGSCRQRHLRFLPPEIVTMIVSLSVHNSLFVSRG